MAFVSSRKKLFIATYDNIINTSEKLESKRWTKLHAAIHSYVISESSTLKELFKSNPSIVQKHVCGMIIQDIRTQVVIGKRQSIEQPSQLEPNSVATRSFILRFCQICRKIVYMS